MEQLQVWLPTIITMAGLGINFAVFWGKIQKAAENRGSFEERVRLTCDYLKTTADKLQLAIDKNDLRYTNDIKELDGKVAALSDRMLKTENKLDGVIEDLDEMKQLVKRKKVV